MTSRDKTVSHWPIPTAEFPTKGPEGLSLSHESGGQEVMLDQDFFVVEEPESVPLVCEKGPAALAAGDRVTHHNGRTGMVMGVFEGQDTRTCVEIVWRDIIPSLLVLGPQKCLTRDSDGAEF